MKVDIIGGGFSGLSCAHWALHRGYRVRLFESSPRLGGLLGTDLPDWGLVETAANGLLNSQAIERLFEELNLKFIPSSRKSRRRYIYRGSPKRWPLHAMASLKLLKRLPSLYSRSASILPQPGQTVQQWGEEHLNAEICDYLLSPAFQGVYATQAERLSASLILNPMLKKKSVGQPQVRGTVAPAGGMGQLIEKWTEHLVRSGVEIHLQSQQRLETRPSHPTIVCVGLSQLSSALDASFYSRFHSLPTVGLCSVTMHFDSAAARLKGFGCLFPRGEGFRALGVLFNNFIFSGRAQGHSETWILPLSETENWTDQDLLESLRQERHKLYKKQDDLLAARVYRWPRAIPLYGLELEQALEDYKVKDNIYLCGNYMGVLGLAKIYEKAQQTIDSIQ